MKDFDYLKFIVASIEGALLVWAGIVIFRFRLCDALMITAAFTIAWSFTFMHTMMGQNASRRGSILNQYAKVSNDMRYNTREEKGFIPETLLVGLTELSAGIIALLYMK